MSARSLALYTAVATAALELGASVGEAGAPHRATLATFAGTWWGHTRSLTIARNGHAAEFISSGCCDPVINLDFRLSRPRGSGTDATAVATVTAVWVRDRAAFTKRSPAPRVGERRVVRLRDGVIVEPLTGTTYCAPSVSKCGA